MKALLHHFSEHVLPGHSSPLCLVQYIIDGQVAPPVWASKRALMDLGENEFFEGLKLESQAALLEHGQGTAITN